MPSANPDIDNRIYSEPDSRYSAGELYLVNYLLLVTSELYLVNYLLLVTSELYLVSYLLQVIKSLTRL